MGEEPKQNVPISPDPSPSPALPDDLQVPITPSAPIPARPNLAPASMPVVPLAKLAVGIPNIPPTSSSPLPSIKPRTRRVNWLMWILGLGVVALLVGTTYFVLTQMSFNRGTLELTFNPGGVRVTIDNKFQKDSVNLLEIKLKAGTHNILVTKDGYVDFERDVELVSGETANLDVKLFPVPSIEGLIDGPVSSVAVTNSGKGLAFVDSTGKFQLYDLSAKVTAPLFDGNLSNIKKVAWSSVVSDAVVRLFGTIFPAGGEDRTRTCRFHLMITIFPI